MRIIRKYLLYYPYLAIDFDEIIVLDILR